MNSEHPYIGMDIHDGHSQVAVMDPDGTLIEERRITDSEENVHELNIWILLLMPISLVSRLALSEPLHGTKPLLIQS